LKFKVVGKAAEKLSRMCLRMSNTNVIFICEAIYSFVLMLLNRVSPSPVTSSKGEGIEERKPPGGGFHNVMIFGGGKGVKKPRLAGLI
jgi:hypothetical protein